MVTTVIILLGVIGLFYILFFTSNTKRQMLYTIKAGKHYCNHRALCLVKGNRLNFVFTLHQNCIYDVPTHKTDIHKLWGFQEGITGRDSARFGWNCINGQLFVYPYVHANGINYGAQDPAPLGRIEPEVEYLASIEILTKDAYLFRIKPSVLTPDTTQYDNRSATHVRGKGSIFGKWQMWFHFGGRLRAPHTMSANIRNL